MAKNFLGDPVVIGIGALAIGGTAFLLLRRGSGVVGSGGWLLNSDVQYFATTNQVFCDIHLVNKSSTSTSLAVRVNSVLSSAGVVIETQDFFLGPYAPDDPQQLTVVFDWPVTVVVSPGDRITVQWEVFLPGNLNTAVATRSHSITV